MRVGQNPAKSIESVPKPTRVTVAVITYIPFLSGYYAHSLEVLRACLSSIWETTDPLSDLLVFDNASCDEVRRYLTNEHGAKRIQYLILSDKNIGKGGAWNFIFQAAPGEFIAYADSDIRFFPGWLKNSLEILEAYPRAGMVTARPMRTPESFYTSTLEWARQEPGVEIEAGTFIPWEVYRQHVLSLGTAEEQAHQWYDSRKDWRLAHRGVRALIGAAHFQFTARKTTLAEFVPFDMERPMGQVRSLDEQINQAGYLRLTTCEPLVMHMGNQLPSDGALTVSPSIPRRRLLDAAVIRKPLLRLYDAIFRLYNE